MYQLARVNGSWVRTTLVSGDYFYNPLTRDASGNLYGTVGFNTQYQDGYVYELSPPANGGNWTQTMLHEFAGGRDGNGPGAGLTWGLDGALYGTTLGGGVLEKCIYMNNPGCGVVFRVAP